MKGITPVISIILLLVIVIVIVGFSFVYFQQTVQTAGEASEQAIDQQINRTAQNFVVEAIDENNVYIRNLGTAPLDNMIFYVNNVMIDVVDISTSNGITKFVLDDSQLILLPDTVTLKASGTLFSKTKTTNFYQNHDVLYLKLDESTGSTATDSSGYDNDGAVNGTWTTGKYGNGMEFDGIDYGNYHNNITVPYDTSLDISIFSISMWLKYYNSSGQSHGALVQQINGKRNTNRILIDYNTDKILAQFSVDGIKIDFNSTATIPEGVWTHLMYTFNGAYERLYINGNMDVENNRPGTLDIGTEPLVFGYSEGQFFFNGTLDEIRMYNIPRGD